ncbi:unnamed protein product [Linum trigynum]|uniref:Uncharacterized protein n=1 Tax=Linum trigynum TaxID=586398 RepID=A0AAV2G8W2_9ROSI
MPARSYRLSCLDCDSSGSGNRQGKECVDDASLWLKCGRQHGCKTKWYSSGLGQEKSLKSCIHVANSDGVLFPLCLIPVVNSQGSGKLVKSQGVPFPSQVECHLAPPMVERALAPTDCEGTEKLNTQLPINVILHFKESAPLWVRHSLPHDVSTVKTVELSEVEFPVISGVSACPESQLPFHCGVPFQRQKVGVVHADSLAINSNMHHTWK